MFNTAGSNWTVSGPTIFCTEHFLLFSRLVRRTLRLKSLLSNTVKKIIYCSMEVWLKILIVFLPTTQVCIRVFSFYEMLTWQRSATAVGNTHNHHFFPHVDNQFTLNILLNTEHERTQVWWTQTLRNTVQKIKKKTKNNWVASSWIAAQWPWTWTCNVSYSPVSVTSRSVTDEIKGKLHPKT